LKFFCSNEDDDRAAFIAIADDDEDETRLLAAFWVVSLAPPQQCICADTTPDMISSLSLFLCFKLCVFFSLVFKESCFLLLSLSLLKRARARVRFFLFF